jgi:hypothetical protein
MGNMPRVIRVLAIVILVVFPAVALGRISSLAGEELRLAYLDPGAGSFMIQALVAALAGIAVTARLYWSKIKSMLGIATSDDDDLDDDE